MVITVTPAQVLEDIQSLRTKGVEVHGQEVSVEFVHGDNDIALADYRYVDGTYHLVRGYDAGVRWPETIIEAGESSPAAATAEPPAAAVQRPAPDLRSVERWEHINQYYRLAAQIESAQENIEQARLTGQVELMAEQQKRLEIGRRSLQQFTARYPDLAGLPRQAESRRPPVNLRTAEGRERGRELVMSSSLPAVEKGMRVVATHKADAAAEFRQSAPESRPIGRVVVRPPMRTAFEDLRQAQQDIQKLNNQGVFSQLLHMESRHNQLLRLESTRRTLELLLKRFPILPGVDPTEQKQLLSVVYRIIQASKQLEQGTRANFLSRLWNQQTLRAEGKKITSGLEYIDRFLTKHPGFV